MFLQLLLFVLIIVIIVLVLNNIAWFIDYYTSKNIQQTTHWCDFPKEYENLNVVKISCSKSKCNFWPDLQNVVSHYDIICQCDDGNYYNITYYYPNEKDIQELLKTRQDARKFKNWYRVDRVYPRTNQFNRKYFTVHDWKYVCKKFRAVKRPVKLSFVYTLVHNVTGVNWGIISHNCHRHAKTVCNIVLDKPFLKEYIHKFNPMHFEFYDSKFKPLIVLKEVMSETFDSDSIWNDYSNDI